MNKAFKTVGFMFVMILLSKVMGQAREMIIAAVYGTTDAANAFYAASTLPLNLFDIVFASAVSSAFIPIYNTYIEKNGNAEGDRFASAFINMTAVLSLFVSIILMVFASPMMSVFAGGLYGEARETAVRLAVIMMPVILFASLTFSCVGILQSKDEFNIPAVISLVSNGAVIIYLLFFNKKFGIDGLAFSLLLGWALQFAVQLPAMKKVGFRYTPKIFYHEGLKDVVKLAIPVLAGTWIQPISNIINNAFATGFEGGISAINYASKLYLIVSAVFTVSVTNYVFPKLSKQSASSEENGYKETMKTSVKVILLVLVPVCALMTALHKPVIEIIYMRGEFDSEALRLTSGAFMYYSFGIVFYGVLDLFNKAFYAKKNSIVPAVTAVCAILLNFVLSFVLKQVMGLFGLALTSSLVYAFMAVTLFTILNRQEHFFGKSEVLFTLKLVIFGIIAYLASAFGYSFMNFGGGTFMNIIRTGLSGVLGFLIYGILVYLVLGKELLSGKN